MTVYKCCSCGRDAFVRINRKTFCQECFIRNVETTTLTTIRDYGMIGENERIGIALSGGKDSVSLLHILSSFQKVCNFDMVAISVDEGIAGYRDESLKIAKLNTQLLGIQHVIVGFEHTFEITIDELARRPRKSVCSVCGPLRRKALNLAAKKIAVHKVATGHNMDDEAQTFIMNILDGRDVTLSPYRKGLRNEVIPRIKPFWGLRQQEIVLYAYLKNLPIYMERDCPYAEGGTRPLVTSFLNQIETRKPDVLLKLSRRMQRENSASVSDRGKTCMVCGEASSRRICNTCDLLRLYQKAKV